MEGTNTVLRPEEASTTSGAAALVAAAMCPPGHECVIGELVWTSDLCDDRPCQCEWGFNGVASDGTAMVAEARRFAGVPRSAIRRALVDRMRTKGYPADVAGRRVDGLLDLAAASPDGTLFRLEHGRPVAFPPGSRVVGPHSIEAPAQRSDR